MKESIKGWEASTHLDAALEKLSADFAAREWQYLDVDPKDCWARAWAWPGSGTEDIVVCVHKGTSIFETFHRQDYFFLNYAYKSSYDAISYRFDNHITVEEGECYVGQPYTGYALNKAGHEEFIIIGVLMKKELFFRSLLPILSEDAGLFHFFLEPRSNEFAEEFIHLKPEKPSPIRSLLEMMVIEYASGQEDTQTVLKSLVMALLVYIARQYRKTKPETEEPGLPQRILSYTSEHMSTVTLKGIAAHFSYHPNYISTLLHNELGKTFSQLLLELRMERAVLLLRGTCLPIEEIANMLGYSNSSNFYRAFRDYYKQSPRQYMSLISQQA